MVDEDDYPKEDDGLPGWPVCIALVLAAPLWFPLAVLLGLACAVFRRYDR